MCLSGPKFCAVSFYIPLSFQDWKLLTNSSCWHPLLLSDIRYLVTHTQRPWLFCSQSMWCGYSFILFRREMRECCCLYEKRGNGDQQLFHLVTHTTVGGLFNFWPKILRRTAVYPPFRKYKKVKNKHGLFFFSPLHITRIHTDIVCQFFSPPPPLSHLFPLLFSIFSPPCHRCYFVFYFACLGTLEEENFGRLPTKLPFFHFSFLTYYILITLITRITPTLSPIIEYVTAIPHTHTPVSHGLYFFFQFSSPLIW